MVSMYLFDVHEYTVDIYKQSDNRIQKATKYESWNVFKEQALALQQEWIFLFDESNFEYKIYNIQISQETVFTRSDYKRIITEKIHTLQQECWCDRDQIRYHITHQVVNKKEVESIIWECGAISFDICCMVWNVELLDLLKNPHLKWYPRRYFVFSYASLFKKKSAALIVIETERILLIKTKLWRYDEIHTLNWWDNLLIQAYEQAWLSIDFLDQKDFSSYTLWEKLLIDVHEQFVNLLLDRLDQYDLLWLDLFVISRLVDQKYFMRSLAQKYVSMYRWRLIPFKIHDNMNFERNWTWEELPIFLACQKLC